MVLLKTSEGLETRYVIEVTSAILRYLEIINVFVNYILHTIPLPPKHSQQVHFRFTNQIEYWKILYPSIGLTPLFQSGTGGSVQGGGG